MTWLYYALGVLFIAFGIGTSIALHELGHLVPAKAFGVKVKQYMIGFGPTLWARRRGETEYGVKAVPLGGYVRMIGMLPPRPGSDPSQLRAGTTGRWNMIADQARAESLEEIEPGDEGRVFYKLSTPRKIVVMLGGPLMNLVIAAVLLTGYVTLYGVLDDSKPTGATISGVTRCIASTPTFGSSGQQQSADCAGKQAAPAYAAGLRPGDRLVSIAGTPVSGPADIPRLVRPNAGTPLDFQVLRDDQPMTFTATPVLGTLPKLDAGGRPITDAAGKAVMEKAGYLGTTTRGSYATVRQPLSEAPHYVWNGVTSTAGVVLRIPEKMVGVWTAAFGDEQRDINGPVSVVGVGRFAGEKAGGELTGSVLDDIDVFPFLIQLLAGLNLALFVFNLIPLMPLDGGHVAGALWEGLKRSGARVLGRPDPGHVDMAKGLPVAYAVSVVLIGMSALLIYADLVKPVRF